MFIYSLPILFAYIQLGSAFEYSLALVLLLSLLYIITPANPFFKDIKWGEVSELTFYQYLFDAWNGQIKLWLVFWPFFILLNSVLFTVDNLAKAGDFSVSSWDVMHLIMFTPGIFWINAIWQNSMNTGYRYWAVLARFMSLAVVFEYGLKLIIRQDYPRIFFQCEEAILNYVSCF